MTQHTALLCLHLHRPLLRQHLLQRRSLLALALAPACALLTSGAAAQQQRTAPAGAASGPGATTTLSRQDRRFLQSALAGGLAEVALARVAQTRASHADVKAYAQRMQQDHTQANEELAQLVNAKFAPADGKPGPAQQRDADRLSKLSGAEFDRAYMRQTVEDHRKTVERFDRASRGADDAQLKTFAAKTLPKLKEHLQMAQALNSKVGDADGKAPARGMGNSASAPAR